jgi:outer membrane immunogenic protein
MMIAAVLLAGVATPAFAQESGFTGPRAEGVIGWDEVKGQGGTVSDNGDGLLYGGVIGYDIQKGGAVIGAEAELTGSTADKRASNLLATGDAFSIDAGRDIYVGARVGATLSDSTLVYAKGGYTNARFNSAYTLGTTTVRGAENLDGWRIGAGLEQKLGGNVYLKAEYRYSDYGEFDNSGLEVSRHQVVGGVGIRF